MRLIKLIVPAVLIAGLALFAAHANAQTMGEYATTTAGVASGGGSMGTSIAPPSVGSDDLAEARDLGRQPLGASFEERAGAASSSAAGGNFDSRAGSMTGGSASQSRWPKSQIRQRRGLRTDSAIRPTDCQPSRIDSPIAPSCRLPDRFPPSHSMTIVRGWIPTTSSAGLDNHYSSSSGLERRHYVRPSR